MHDAAAWNMIICSVFDTVFLRLPVLAVLRGSILWTLLVLSVLQYFSIWGPIYCACLEYEEYEY